VIEILFNSIAFLYFAIIVFIGVMLIRNKDYQYFFLLVASCFFYWYSSGSILLILLLSILADYYIAKAITSSLTKGGKKFYLILSLIVNLGVLGYFKYTNFFIESINLFLSNFSIAPSMSTLSIVLPIGISFYTFQKVSYILDVYWGYLKAEESLLKFSLYVAFFPQLVAGPIVRAKDFLYQLNKKIKITPENAKAGLTLVAWGLIKKVVFADNIAVFANYFFSDPHSYPGSIPVILATLAFGIQIYCDFSGYSDIAIGLARIMGLKLLLNFDKPYFAENVTIFWRKWHISLSNWLRDYLYIPLGGNRKGTKRTYINLMITMTLGGLWHGANWNFLIWGVYHGFILAMHKFFKAIGVTNVFNIFKKYSTLVSILITQYFVFFGWLIFRVSNTDYLMYVMKKFVILDFTAWLATTSTIISKFEMSFIFIATFIVLHVYTYFHQDIVEKLSKLKIGYWLVYIAGMILLLYLFNTGAPTQFIYFRF